eukprot:TRINITY_DN1228_c0_g1_i1.p1 TRINITY_DN1228_c0_g1~~TRINITY_DN1228_c0_g1_i1.p1  ORF type:complete len:151 (+),score=40.63 TRINITY_DN1228_c0_g1_i1:234-686(+)
MNKFFLLLALAFVCVGAISRKEIMARAQVWVDQHIPYSQSKTHDGWRTDCSGFVSMCWKLNKPGLTTRTLPGVSYSISKEELKPGDCLLNPGDHVILFGGWENESKTHYYAFEEVNTKLGTKKRLIPYPYWSDASPQKFHPRRYKNVTDV